MTFLFFFHYNLLFSRDKKMSTTKDKKVSPGPAFGRCNRSRNWYGQIVQMHGYISNFMTTMLSDYAVQTSLSLSLSLSLFFLSLSCKFFFV